MQGSEEPAGTHEKPDQSRLWKCCVHVPSGLCDIGSDRESPLQHECGSVLGESLQHYGIKRNVLFTNRTGSTMDVNFEVTDTTRAILSVHKG